MTPTTCNTFDRGRRESPRHAAILIALALISRGAFFAWLAHTGSTAAGPNSPGFWDSTDGYVALASNLVESGRFAFAPDAPPTVYRGPVYPAAIALVTQATRDVGLAVLCVNTLAACAMTVFVYLLARRFYAARVCLLLAALTSLHPVLVYYAASSFSDAFLAAIIVASAWTTIKSLETRRAVWMIVAGLAWAACAATKPIFAPLPFAAVAVAAIGRRPWLRPLAVQAVVMIVALLPWVARNYRLTKRPMLAAGGGFNLLVGQYVAEHDGGCDACFRAGVSDALADVTAATGRPITRGDIMTVGFYDLSPAQDAMFLSRALHHAAESPARFVRKVAVNAVRFWCFGSTPARRLGLAMLNLPIVALAAWELYRVRRTAGDAVAWLILLTAYVWLAYSAIIVHSRFYLVLLPLLAPLAMARAWQWIIAPSAAAARRRIAGHRVHIEPPAPSRGSRAAMGAASSD